MLKPISSLSSPLIHSFITGAAGTETIQMAFVQAAQPSSGDWKAAAWGSVTPTGAWAHILIGPASASLTLTAGTWQVWVKATSTPEIPVMRSGEIEIT